MSSNLQCELDELSKNQLNIADEVLASDTGKRKQSTDTSDKMLAIFRNACLTIARTKDLQRRIHTKLAEKARLVAQKRARVDDARLALDNLSYKRAHLLREISNSKSLATPELTSLCNESNVSISIGDESSRLEIEDNEEKALGLMEAEEDARRTLVQTLEDKRATNAKLNVTGDGHRQRLQDARLKFDLVAASATDLVTTLNSRGEASADTTD